ncbi:hypothetical protein NUM3379_34340 [Kineococcus sp. NUM-3379]
MPHRAATASSRRRCRTIAASALAPALSPDPVGVATVRPPVVLRVPERAPNVVYRFSGDEHSRPPREGSAGARRAPRRRRSRITIPSRAHRITGCRPTSTNATPAFTRTRERPTIRAEPPPRPDRRTGARA